MKITLSETKGSDKGILRVNKQILDLAKAKSDA